MSLLNQKDQKTISNVYFHFLNRIILKPLLHGQL
jgi:hypothetical protein